MSRRTEGIIIITVTIAVLSVVIAIMGIDTPILIILLCIAGIGIGISVLSDRNGKVKKYVKEDEVIDSRKLHEEMNQERKQEGQNSVQAINTIGGVSTNNLARKDKSWNSVPDFFIKMVKGNNKE